MMNEDIFDAIKIYEDSYSERFLSILRVFKAKNRNCIMIVDGDDNNAVINAILNMLEDYHFDKEPIERFHKIKLSKVLKFTSEELLTSIKDENKKEEMLIFDTTLFSFHDTDVLQECINLLELPGFKNHLIIKTDDRKFILNNLTIFSCICINVEEQFRDVQEEVGIFASFGIKCTNEIWEEIYTLFNTMNEDDEEVLISNEKCDICFPSFLDMQFFTLGVPVYVLQDKYDIICEFKKKDNEILK